MKVILHGTELNSIKQSKKVLNENYLHFSKKLYISGGRDY